MRTVRIAAVAAVAFALGFAASEFLKRGREGPSGQTEDRSVDPGAGLQGSPGANGASGSGPGGKGAGGSAASLLRGYIGPYGGLASVSVVDWNGKPVSGAVIALSAHKARLDGMMLTAKGVTDESGKAELRGFQEGESYRLDVSIPGREDLAELHSKEWKSGSDASVLHLERGFSVSGRVVGSAGGPVGRKGAVFYRESAAGADVADLIEAFDAEGRFRLVRLSAGRYSVRATMDNVVGSPVLVEVAADVEGVVLGLEVTAAKIRVDGWTPALGSFAVFTSKDGAHRQIDREVINGTINATGIDPDKSYVLWVAPRTSKDALHVYEKDFKLVSAASVEAREGRWVSGKLSDVEGKSQLSVVLSGLGVVLRARILPDGTFEFRGVPEGEWIFSAFASGQGKSFRGEARVRPGDMYVNIELGPD